jgi:hypothetical protein
MRFMINLINLHQPYKPFAPPYSQSFFICWYTRVVSAEGLDWNSRSMIWQSRRVLLFYLVAHAQFAIAEHQATVNGLHALIAGQDFVANRGGAVIFAFFT